MGHKVTTISLHLALSCATCSAFPHVSFLKKNSMLLGLFFCKLDNYKRHFREIQPLIYFTSLHFTSLHFTSRHVTSRHVTSLHFASLRFTSRHFTSLRFASPPFPSLRFTSLRFASLRFASLRFASLHFPSLRFASLHFTSLILPTTRLLAVCMGLFCSCFLLCDVSMRMGEGCCFPTCCPGALVGLRIKLRAQQNIQVCLLTFKPTL